jgi:DNA-directed RNA polymerase specialized sigma24 family protein
MQDGPADVAMAKQVLAGEPTGYAELYDRYATPLYSYCHSMLLDQERALTALSLTLMTAVCRLGELRDANRLRPWLYALARTECRCRADGRAGSGPAGLADLVSAVAGDAGEAEGRQRSESPPGAGGQPPPAGELSQADIAAAALRWLSLDDRDVIELCLRHHLAGPDLNDVLGLPAGRAHAAVTRACARLKRALGTLQVARWGRGDCPDLAGMLVGWDGRPTVLMRQRVRRHIGCCDTCRTREEREVPTKALAGLLAAAAPVAPPPGLRDDMLRLLAKTASAATEGDLIADLVAHRPGSFGSSGFPAPPRRGIWRAGRR